MTNSAARHAWKLGIIALGCLLLASCGSQGRNPAALDAIELLDLLDGKEQRLDLDKYGEVEVGSFKITLAAREDERALKVKFRLYAVIPESQKASFAIEFPKYEKRIRDAVISLVQRTDQEQLAEPSLNYLKAEIVATINRILQKRVARDAVFSSFSLGYQWPREEEESERPKPSAHH